MIDAIFATVIFADLTMLKFGTMQFGPILFCHSFHCCQVKSMLSLKTLIWLKICGIIFFSVLVLVFHSLFFLFTMKFQKQKTSLSQCFGVERYNFLV